MWHPDTGAHSGCSARPQVLRALNASSAVRAIGAPTVGSAAAAALVRQHFTRRANARRHWAWLGVVRLVETQPGCRLSLKMDAMKLSDGQDFVTVK